MRYPITSIRLDCGVNRYIIIFYCIIMLYSFFVNFRIAVSHDHHVLALPLDNGQIRLYDLGGNRLATLPNRNRKVTINITKYSSVLMLCTSCTLHSWIYNFLCDS